MPPQNNGNMPRVPDRSQLSQYVVNREGWEAIKQSLYDFQSYSAAGETQLTFFALPVGQGGKTLSDTNMTLAGQLPTNQEFLVQSIEVVFFPTTPTVAAQMPGAFGAQAAAEIINDTYIFRRSGNLQLIIGSKPYLQESPLLKFPQKARFDVDAAAADQSTSGADMQTRIAYANACGRPYLLDPAPLLLTSNQNFAVTLSWPEGVQAITNAARVGVIMDGILYRRSQ